MKVLGRRAVIATAGALAATGRASAQNFPSKPIRIIAPFGPGTATDTVALFTSQLNQLGLADNDGVALDLEVTDGRTPAQVSAWAVQVMEALADYVERAALQAGDRLPTERELMMALSVGRLKSSKPPA